jgi:hypothetical protein
MSWNCYCAGPSYSHRVSVTGGADKEGNPVNNLNQSLASFNFDRGSRRSNFNSIHGVHGITRDSQYNSLIQGLANNPGYQSLNS